jgi:hypothetical protein
VETSQSRCSGAQYAKIQSNDHVRYSVNESGTGVETRDSDSVFWDNDDALMSDDVDARRPLDDACFESANSARVVNGDDFSDEDHSSDENFDGDEERSDSECDSEESVSGSEENEDAREQRVRMKWDW